MKLAKTYAFLKKDLSVIEDALEETVYANQPVLHEASVQLLKAGGKRLRPIFVLLASKFGEYNLSYIKNVASSLELIHMASLVHDDVIDNSNMRRGKPTVKAKWDNQVAMLTGDYIFAKALQQFTEIQQPRAHQILSDTMIELTMGEIEQIKDKFNIEQNFRTYLRRIKRKTALLISSSCQLGAIVANTDKKTETALYRYGYYMGMSYQIIDDILDFTASEKELGKPAGSDLLQGNITLPVLFAIEDPALHKELSTLFRNPAHIKGETLLPIIAKISSSDAIKRARKVSDMYLQKAYDSLQVLPNNQAKEALENIANYIGNRQI
ncbi:heptaprenyl diphosphate synthase component II [Gracilibacillus boraciitolerans JCM 21714]|uniref:Heptaprenyl diphosphate synthase component 2 n=1 Tax=Gracilibacillus boraciitolerans JCM 21714 TaxID=1298598 RepID=W4VEX2_9BACI|nr:heptaprenyl diphosphate synthase component II [Gracilibacillus boraciitolerans]GAE91363.1 heptaprenyl diphosphate synthase component II [Gracilibacillus boraciitolerans JCM 21714]